VKINFVLPPNGDHPVGGFKIVFQYANQLVKNGNDVSITFLNSLYPEKHSKFVNLLLRTERSVLKKNLDNTQITWFNLDKRIKLFFNVIYNNEIPKSDVIVATAVQTAKYINGMDEKFGRKYYFIQNYETWAYSEDEVNDTFSLPYTKVVISKWLYGIVKEFTNDEVYVVPNFIDPDIFYLSKNIKDRKNVVSMLYHTLPEKNVEFGLSVLKNLKSKIPDLKVNLFGVFEKPDNLPEYIDYYEKPTQKELCNKIYGESKVYLLPSLLEGWGLTCMEAMASGAVLVSSDIGGVADYTSDGKNSFLVKPNDLRTFSNKIERLLRNDNLRLKMANSATKINEDFSIKKSTSLLEKIFNLER